MSEINTIVDSPINPTHGRAELQDLKAYILKLAIIHFSDARHIRNAALKSFVYRRPSPDAAPTTLDPNSIVITTRGKFDPATTGIRPALVLKRGKTNYSRSLTFSGAVQGDLPLRGTPGVNPTYDATAGGAQYQYDGQMEFTFYCLHTEEAAAEILGDEVQQMLLGFRHLVMQEKGLNEFMPGEAGEAGPLEEYKEIWAVPVTINIQFNLTVNLIPQTPLLRRFTARLFDAAGTGTLG